MSRPSREEIETDLLYEIAASLEVLNGHMVHFIGQFQRMCNPPFIVLPNLIPSEHLEEWAKKADPAFDLPPSGDIGQTEA